MDYKKKYEELLARLQEAKEKVYKTDERYCCVIDSIVPELKESEEEKTKRMLDVITYKMSQHQPDIFTGEENEWLNDWIEKQGQTFTKKDVDDAYLKGICDAKHELEKQGEKGTNGNEREIPNSVWNEEDEKMFRGIITICDIWSTKTSFYPKQNDDIVNLKKWLKSLKGRVQQPKQEWSKEDEKILDRVITNYEGGYLPSVEKRDEIIEKLKSLKDRHTWKPSDEQMKALNIAISCGIQLGTWEEDALKSLKEQLFKLKKLKD